MTTRSVYRRRLAKLAEHLERGKLIHREFAFHTFNGTGWSDEAREAARDAPAGCGLAGCAIGECPAVFPRQWKFKHVLAFMSPVPVVGGSNSPTVSSCRFFGLTTGEFQHLFVPMAQDVENFGGKVLGFDATRRAVARGLRTFLARTTRTRSKAK